MSIRSSCRLRRWASFTVLVSLWASAAQLTATNGFLTVEVDDSSGNFSVKTGASHPHPDQRVLYPFGASLVLRDATALVMWVNRSAGDPGLAGYTESDMNAAPPATSLPVVTALGSTGFRTTWTLPHWLVVQDVVISGTTLSDSVVREGVTVTNTTGSSRQYGLRTLWDIKVANVDASFIAQRVPDGAFLSDFTTFNNPTFALYEVVDIVGAPTFSMYATVRGGSLSPAPTAPDQFRFAGYGASTSSDWDFTNTGGGTDSAVVYYWGFNAPLTLGAGQSATYTQYLTTQPGGVHLVPTLSEWGVLIFSGLMALGAWFSLRRRGLVLAS